MAEENLFGNLLQAEGFYRASTIVEDRAVIIPPKPSFYCTSPTMSWGSAVGYTPGMMELLYGPKSSGKTMIVLDRMKNCLHADPKAIVVLVDAEMNFEFESTIRWMTANGVDTSRVLIIRDVCLKKIFEQKLLGTLQKEILAGNAKVSYIAIDSIQAMSAKNIPTHEMIQKKGGLSGKSGIDYTKQDYGATANFLSRIFPFYRMFCRDTRVFTTFIGQARNDGTDRFGNEMYKTSGGEALYHEVQYRTFVNQGAESMYSGDKDINGQPIKIGHRINFEFEKNKAGEGLGRKGYCDVVYMKGIVNVEEEMVQLCAKLGIINQAGAWYDYDGKKAQGASGFGKILREDRDLYSELFSRVMARASTTFDPINQEVVVANEEQVQEEVKGEAKSE